MDRRDDQQRAGGRSPDFAENLVRTEGVLIMPGSVFDLPGNFFRIGFGKRNMANILERFESYLHRQG